MKYLERLFENVEYTITENMNAKISNAVKIKWHSIDQNFVTIAEEIKNEISST